MGVFVYFKSAVHFEELIQHVVQLLPIAGVRLHCVFEGLHDVIDLSLELFLLVGILDAVLIHLNANIYYTCLLPSKKKVREQKEQQRHNQQRYYGQKNMRKGERIFTEIIYYDGSIK